MYTYYNRLLKNKSKIGHKYIVREVLRVTVPVFREAYDDDTPAQTMARRRARGSRRKRPRVFD